MPQPSFTETYHHSPYSAIDPTRPELSAKGKVILVSGAGSGVGAATALAFAKAGAKAIGLIGRRAEALKETTTQIRSFNTTTVIYPYPVSIGDEDAVESSFSEFAKASGPIDVCVNTAAYYSNKATVKDGDLADFWEAFEIGVKGAYIIAQQFLRNCSDTGGVLIGINSSGALLPASSFTPSPASYASHKIAAAKLYEYVAVENPQIRCYSIHPGVIETDMSRKAMRSRGVVSSTPTSSSFGAWDSGMLRSIA